MTDSETAIKRESVPSSTSTTTSRATLTDRGFTPELCRRIVHHVSASRSSDLATLARVCSEFQREAERLLYHNIQAHGPSSILRWCKLLIDCPRVAAHVRVLVVEFPPQYSSITRRSSFSDPVYLKLCVDSLQMALLNTHALETLVYVDPKRSAVALNPPDDTPARFQLIDLRAQCLWDDMFAKFLNGQKKLQSLLLHDDLRSPGPGQDGYLAGSRSAPMIVPPQGLTEAFVAPLTEVQAHWPLIIYLTPGKPVLSIKTIYPMPIRNRQDEEWARYYMPVFLKQLALGTVPLLELHLGETMTPSVSLAALKEAALHLPYLRQLGLLLLPQDQPTKFFTLLSQLHHLRAIEISVAHFKPSALYMTEALTNQLASYANPPLSTVIFVLDDGDRQKFVKKLVVSHLPGEAPDEYDEWTLLDSADLNHG